MSAIGHNEKLCIETRNEIVKHHQGLSTLANVFIESSYQGSMLF